VLPSETAVGRCSRRSMNKAASRPGARPNLAPVTLSALGYELDFAALYSRLWEVSEDLGDGTRLYTSFGDQALKWIIADLSGTPAESGKTMEANDSIRQQIYATFKEAGWADRIGQRKFRLLVEPRDASGQVGVPETSEDGQLVPLSDPEDDGTVVEAVAASAVTDEGGRLSLGGLHWSDWVPLSTAVNEATTSPGVYAARADGQVVYVGMAGERRGQGVRGRLTIYARGRGAVSGLGEAVLDRALADPEWLKSRLDDLRDLGPARTRAWAVAAFERSPLDVSWAATGSGDQARDAERRVLIALTDVDLWNRARPKKS